MQQAIDQTMSTANALEARYAYYRRCQERCKGGEQCKAPAEKGAAACYAHARQRSMAARREAERLAVLAKAVAEMRRRGEAEVGMADLFTSFNGIKITIATAAQALIEGSLDCKTAGRLLWDLQRMAKLLSVYEKSKGLPLIHTDNTDQNGRIGSEYLGATVQEAPIIEKLDTKSVWAANEHEKARIHKKILEFSPDCRWSKGPPLFATAA